MKFISMFVLGMIVLTMGCQSAPKSFDDALMLVDKAAAIAEKQGTAYSATVRWDGKLGGAWIQRAELDSGVTVEVNFHGNAAAERAAVQPNP